MPPRTRRAPQVHKFGGASLADSAAVQHAVALIRSFRREPTIVVVSAMAGGNEALLEVARQGGRGDHRSVGALIAQLRSRHGEVARTLLPSGPARTRMLDHIADLFHELEDLVQGLRGLKELTPRTLDSLIAMGEQLSARLVVAALQQEKVRTRYVDALDLVHTDAVFGHASPDLARTERSVKRVLLPLVSRGIVAVVPGFLGATPAGEVATLGRGGSDLTATLLARGVGASQVCLWKDVAGLLTADPRVVPDARVIPQLHAREAAELAYYGAKVLHPRALIPVSGRPIPVFVRPFADPTAAGTEISSRRTLDKYPVKALSAVGGQALLAVAGNGMLGVPGIAARTFEALHLQGISVSLISQSSSEQSICFSVPEGSARRARDRLAEEFRDQITRGEIDGIDSRSGLATVAVVGIGMAGHLGIAARVFAALAEAKINIVAIAQGSSELNISFVVAAKDVAAAQRAVHGAFQLSKIGGGAATRAAHTDAVLLGF